MKKSTFFGVANFIVAIGFYVNTYIWYTASQVWGVRGFHDYAAQDGMVSMAFFVFGTLFVGVSISYFVWYDTEPSKDGA